VTTVVIALIAGAEPIASLAAGSTMFALQVSIGAYNDLVDSPFDAGRRPAKPIPAGLVSHTTAVRVTIGGLVVGLILAATFGSLAFAIAAAGAGCGYTHSRWTKGTPVAVVPFAVGIALLPTFAWVVATGQSPPLAIVVLGAAGGVAIGLANAAADREGDTEGGLRTPAVRLGRRRTNVLVTLILAAVAVTAIATMVGFRPGPVAVITGAAGLCLVGAGVALAWRPPRRSQLAWELDAAGLAMLGIAWLTAATGTG